MVLKHGADNKKPPERPITDSDGCSSDVPVDQEATSITFGVRKSAPGFKEVAWNSRHPTRIT